MNSKCSAILVHVSQGGVGDNNANFRILKVFILKTKCAIQLILFPVFYLLLFFIHPLIIFLSLSHVPHSVLRCHTYHREKYRCFP